VRSVFPSRVFLACSLCVGVALVIGCGTSGVLGPVGVASGRVAITGPEDGELLNSQVINVRGNAIVGTIVNVYVDGTFAGSDVAGVTPPPDTLGRFTVEDVDLGAAEEPKVIAARASDGEGNVSDHGDTVIVVLDTTAPPADVLRLQPAEWVPGEEHWLVTDRSVIFFGRTDTTAIIVRVRAGVVDYLPAQSDTFAAGPGEPDSVRVQMQLIGPPLAAARPDSIMTYTFQTIDRADNYTEGEFVVRWVEEVGR